MKARPYLLALFVLFAVSNTSFAQTPADINTLRTQIDALKADYEKRIQALETQLQQLQTQIQTAPKPEAAAAAAPVPAGATAQVPPGAEGAGGPSGQLPAYGGGASGSKALNPNIAGIGDFLAAAGSNKVNPDPAFGMHGSEGAFQ